MNTEDYDDDNLDSFDSWVEEYRKMLEDDFYKSEMARIQRQADRLGNEFMVEYLEGTIPSSGIPNDPRLKVYEDYLNRKDGE